MAFAANTPEDDQDLARAAELRVAKLSSSALDLLDAVEARNVGHPDTLAEAGYQKGLLLEEAGLLPDALAAYEHVEAAAPGAPATLHARLSRARLLARSGKPQDALAAYAALAFAPPALAAPALLERAGLADTVGRRLEALGCYRNLLRSFPKAPEAREARAALDAVCAKLMAGPVAATLVAESLARGDCLTDRARYADAVAVYRAALDRRSTPEERATLFLALGQAYDAQEDFAAAERAYRKVVKSLPGSPEAATAQMAIVQARLDRGRLPEAVRELQSIVKAYPGTPAAAQAQFMAATCWEALHDRRKAEEAYRAVLDLAPLSIWGVEAQQSLVRLLERAP